MLESKEVSKNTGMGAHQSDIGTKWKELPMAKTVGDSKQGTNNVLDYNPNYKTSIHEFMLIQMNK